MRAESNTKAHKQRQKTEVGRGVAGPCDTVRVDRWRTWKWGEKDRSSPSCP